MANYYNDPTANTVMGILDREIDQKEILADLFWEVRQIRPLTKKEEKFARNQFRGIHQRLLKVALGPNTKAVVK